MSIGTEPERRQEHLTYKLLPTMARFHRNPAQMRCIVGPVGSGKTTTAAMEVVEYLPRFLKENYGITKTRGVVVRNFYRELMDSTVKTIFKWFPWGDYRKSDEEYILKHRNGYQVDMMFRALDRPKDVRKLKSVEITWYWIDESIEVDNSIKKMLKTRIGRFPDKIPGRWGIETTNPPDVEHPTYSQFAWDGPIPGPVPEKAPLENHAGFWQPPYENVENLRPGYYDDLRHDFRDDPDWIERYIESMPGIMIQGKLVYNNFKRDYHVSKGALLYSGGTLVRGWDNSGNCPACVLIHQPAPLVFHVLREFCGDKEGIVDFALRVQAQCNADFSTCDKYIDYGDPSGRNKFPKKDGGFTSNAKLMENVIKIKVISSDNNFTARVQAVDQALGRINGLLIDPSCVRLINGFLGGYCYPEIGNSGIYGEHPIKNRFSHPHDGLQYALLKMIFGGGTKKVKVLGPIPADVPSPDAWMH